MEEEGVPSTALREVSLLQMLSESIFVVRCVSCAVGEFLERQLGTAAGGMPCFRGSEGTESAHLRAAAVK